MKYIHHALIGSLFFFLCGSSPARSQSRRINPAWLKEVVIGGIRVQQLRVPEEAINSRAVFDIKMIQRDLEKAWQDYLDGNTPRVDWLINNFGVLRNQDPGWPVEYYVRESDAFQAYNKSITSEQLNRMYGHIVQKSVRDSLRDGYCFISKPFVYLKATATNGGGTLGKLYFGSYIKVLDTDELGVALVSVGGMTGEIHTGDYVENIYKLNATDEQWKLVTTQGYYRFEKDTAVVATVAAQKKPVKKKDTTAIEETRLPAPATGGATTAPKKKD
ncbi:MAG TPA: hypothetical protein VGM30_24525 [Puia sp.]|jgi:hypothetical protein